MQGLFGLMRGMFNIPEGGDDPTQPLSPKQRADWNKYVDWLKAKGYSGSRDLDKKETGLARKLIDDFRKENPDATIDYNNVKQVQMEMQQLKQNVQGFAARRNDPNADKLMSGISQVDGWPGSKTTQFKFPDMQAQEFMNGNLVNRMDMGLLSGAFKPTGIPQQAAAPVRKLPPGAKLEEVVDSNGVKSIVYQDPSSGDLIKWE